MMPVGLTQLEQEVTSALRNLERERKIEEGRHLPIHTGGSIKGISNRISLTSVEEQIEAALQDLEREVEVELNWDHENTIDTTTQNEDLLICSQISQNSSLSCLSTFIATPSDRIRVTGSLYIRSVGKDSLSHLIGRQITSVEGHSVETRQQLQSQLKSKRAVLIEFK